MIVGVDTPGQTRPHISTDLLRATDTRAMRGWITGAGSKWITRLIYSLSEISKKSILAAEKSLIFCPESDGGGVRLQTPDAVTLTAPDCAL